MKKIPYITQQGNRKVLMVDDAPFIMLAGEVHNSNSSSAACMEQVWNRAKELEMNTLLLPVTWELIEPQEGVFDFSLVDALATKSARWLAKPICSVRSCTSILSIYMLRHTPHALPRLQRPCL